MKEVLYMIKLYGVEIKEILSKTVYVWASSYNEAESTVSAFRKDEKIVLTADDFCDVEYQIDNSEMRLNNLPSDAVILNNCLFSRLTSND